jgi:hypothetical protein
MCNCSGGCECGYEVGPTGHELDGLIASSHSRLHLLRIAEKYADKRAREQSNRRKELQDAHNNLCEAYHKYCILWKEGEYD